MKYAIETTNLSKEFTYARTFVWPPFSSRRQKRISAVNDVSLQIKKGESFGLFGPNGSGKTTLIKLLATLILPTKGKAYVNGYNIISDERKVRSSIGVVISEERSFYWRLTGRQNLNFFAALYGLSSTQASKKINELVSLLEIEEYMDSIFYKYSTGIKQRFSIARSLLDNPQILFMDEPTKSLDTRSAQHLRRFIKETLVYEQGKTVLFTTHNYDEAVVLSDRLAIIEKGEIKACGTPDESGQMKEHLQRIMFNHTMSNSG